MLQQENFLFDDDATSIKKNGIHQHKKEQYITQRESSSSVVVNNIFEKSWDESFIDTTTLEKLLLPSLHHRVYSPHLKTTLNRNCFHPLYNVNTITFKKMLLCEGGSPEQENNTVSLSDIKEDSCTSLNNNNTNEEDKTVMMINNECCNSSTINDYEGMANVDSIKRESTLQNIIQHEKEEEGILTNEPKNNIIKNEMSFCTKIDNNDIKHSIVSETMNPSETLNDNNIIISKELHSSSSSSSSIPLLITTNTNIEGSSSSSSPPPPPPLLQTITPAIPIDTTNISSLEQQPSSLPLLPQPIVHSESTSLPLLSSQQPIPLDRSRPATFAARSIYAEQFCQMKKSKPAPIGVSRHYPVSPTYKGNKKLFDYQLEGLNWLLSLWSSGNNGILADEMGLGKTIQSIALLWHFYTKEKMRGPFLVVAPLSTLDHWKVSVETWTDFNVILYYDEGRRSGRDALRRVEWYHHMVDLGNRRANTRTANDDATNNHNNNNSSLPPPPCLIPTYHYKFQVLLTSYEVFASDAELLVPIPWQFVIVDEAHRLKNRFSKTLQLLKQVACRHTLLLTGTPVQNNTEELWPLLNYIEPVRFCDVEAFKIEFGDLQTNEQVTRLTALLRPHLLRRVKEDVAESIPPLEETIIDVELTMLQKNEAEQFKKLIESSGKLVLLDKLLPKLKDEEHKVLIFSQFQHTLTLIQEFLQYKGWDYERLDGQVRGADRSGAIARFNDPTSNKFVFLLSTRAGGLGINLTSADTVIIFDSDWNPQNDIQATARAHRIGQEREVKVYRLVTARTYEADMFDRASKKLGLNTAVFHRGAFDSKSRADRRKKDDQSESSISGSKIPSKTEIEELLKKGAFYLLESNADASREFQENNIEEILSRNSRLVRYQLTGMSSTFAKTSFKSDKASDLSLDDPDFWQKILNDSSSRRLLARLNDGSATASQAAMDTFMVDLRAAVEGIAAEDDPEPVIEALVQLSNLTTFSSEHREQAEDWLARVNLSLEALNNAEHHGSTVSRLSPNDATTGDQTHEVDISSSSTPMGGTTAAGLYEETSSKTGGTSGVRRSTRVNRAEPLSYSEDKLLWLLGPEDRDKKKKGRFRKSMTPVISNDNDHNTSAAETTGADDDVCHDNGVSGETQAEDELTKYERRLMTKFAQNADSRVLYREALDGVLSDSMSEVEDDEDDEEIRISYNKRKERLPGRRVSRGGNRGGGGGGGTKRKPRSSSRTSKHSTNREDYIGESEATMMLESPESYDPETVAAAKAAGLTIPGITKKTRRPKNLSGATTGPSLKRKRTSKTTSITSEPLPIESNTSTTLLSTNEPIIDDDTLSTSVIKPSTSENIIIINKEEHHNVVSSNRIKKRREYNNSSGLKQQKIENLIIKNDPANIADETNNLTSGTISTPIIPPTPPPTSESESAYTNNNNNNNNNNIRTPILMPNVGAITLLQRTSPNHNNDSTAVDDSVDTSTTINMELTKNVENSAFNPIEEYNMTDDNNNNNKVITTLLQKQNNNSLAYNNKIIISNNIENSDYLEEKLQKDHNIISDSS